MILSFQGFHNEMDILQVLFDSDIHIDSYAHDQFKTNQIKQIVEFILSYDK